MNPIQTLREALEILRGAVGHADTIATADKALTALAELERTHYTAEDVADASAQGFRDGVASVTAGQEPVAWQILNGVCHAGIRSSETLAKEAADGMQKTHDLGGSLAAFHVRPLYAAPVAQQPRGEVVVTWDEPRTRILAVTRQDEEGRVLSVIAEAPAQQPQARPDFTDEWTGYLKDGETPFERFLRERKDLNALTKLYQRALEENERLKAQQPLAVVRPIQECYGDCPTDPKTCANPCKFNGRPAPQQAEAVPNVCASFLTERADMIGTTKAPIKRVAWEDDGTLHVYIDHWPQQIEASPEKEDFCYCNDEISLQIVSGGAAPEGLYGRVTLKVNGEYVGYVKDVAHQSEQTPTARYIGDLAGIVDAARKEPLEQIVSLCETIRYMVGIAERGSGEKCPDDMAPEVFLLRYVQRLEAALEFVARHKSSDWPERCQQMVDAARSTLAAPQQAEAVPPDVVRDAERYRWLRDKGFAYADVDLGTDFDEDTFVSYRIKFNVPEPAHYKFEDDEWTATDIDAAIDAAMAQGEKP